MKVRISMQTPEGNIFNLLGVARKMLKKAGKKKEASEMIERAMKARSYKEVVKVINEYCPEIEVVDDNN